MKILLFKPGVLTFEYVRGKRASFLHPIRMYIFTSAMFFLISISYISHKKNQENLDPKLLTAEEQGAIKKTIDRLNDTLKKISDIDQQKRIQAEVNALQKVPEFFALNETLPVLPPGVQFDSSNKKAIDSAHGVLAASDLPSSIAEYNERQSNLPPEKKDGWLLREVNFKLIKIKEKYEYNEKALWDALTENFLHDLPAMMFISLPIAALLFKLLYIRRKQFTYVQHGVFIVHIYSAIYIFILILDALGVLNGYLHWSLLSFLVTTGIITIFYYVYRAMRNFYEQGRWKTVFKYALYLFSYLFVLLILLVIFILVSATQL